MGGVVLPRQATGADRGPDHGGPGTRAAVLAGERAARRDLRDQIARLERQLGDAFVTAFPFGGLPPVAGTPAAPAARLLTLGELEQVRDDLAARLSAARAGIAEHADRQERARLAREHAFLDPAGHRFARISCRELGEPGCAWEVRPRLGLIGMLMGWWQVKLSSGCPLPGLIGTASCARC